MRRKPIGQETPGAGMGDNDPDIANRARYEALIESVQQTRSLWIAESEDAVLTLEDETGDELLLVWPTEESAAQTIAARPNLVGFKPVVRSLERWLGTTTVRLVEERVLVAAHPDRNLACLKVPPRDFARDLQCGLRLQSTDLNRAHRRRQRGSR